MCSNFDKKLDKTFNEISKVTKNIDNVYVILKNGGKAGIITNRWTYTQWYVAHVTLIMYGAQATGKTETRGGYGYDKFAHSMASILNDLKEPLKERFNIDVDSVEDKYNHWQDVFTNSGYQLIQLF